MPTLDWNRETWSEAHDWSQKGDNWSSAWGSVDLQWYGCIFPRIHNFLPTKSILEIGPGFGRWSQFLKDNCTQLTLVDISPKCIEACQKRFQDSRHVNYYVTERSSLDMIPDQSINFVFSFDSLVHAEEDIIREYLIQLSKKLTPDGVGFIHHSNLGEYKTYFGTIRKVNNFLRKFKGGQNQVYDPNVSSFQEKGGPLLRSAFFLSKLRIIDNGHSRAISMTASKFSQFADESGLICSRQEIINWDTKRLIDCISIFTRPDSCWTKGKKIVRNSDFMKEAALLSKCSNLYSEDTFKK